jgi:hypothetical protein
VGNILQSSSSLSFLGGYSYAGTSMRHCTLCRYKHSIVAISAREKELESALQQNRQLVSSYEEEAG